MRGPERGHTSNQTRKRIFKGGFRLSGLPPPKGGRIGKYSVAAHRNFNPSGLQDPPNHLNRAAGYTGRMSEDRRSFGRLSGGLSWSTLGGVAVLMLSVAVVPQVLAGWRSDFVLNRLATSSQPVTNPAQPPTTDEPVQPNFTPAGEKGIGLSPQPATPPSEESDGPPQPIEPAPAAQPTPAPTEEPAASSKQSQGAPTDPLAIRGPDEWVAIINGQDAPVPDVDLGDNSVTYALLEEGKLRNEVMDHLTTISHDIGTRLTGSSNMQRAADWCEALFKYWGLQNVHQEEWGTIGVRFDRGACSGRFFEPVDKKGSDGTTTTTMEPTHEVELSALSWSAGTDGPVRGHVVREPKTEEEYNNIKDELAGAWVLLEAPSSVGQRGIRSILATRSEMRKEARRKIESGVDVATLPIPERLVAAGVAGYISTSRDERVWTGAVSGWRDLTLETVQPDVHVLVRLSDYDWLNSRLTDGIAIEAEFNVKHKFTQGPISVPNVIADIPGSEFPDEYVIISGHMDSWDGPGSQGTQDNGTGTCVTLETARILAKVLAEKGVQPKRTIRFILWTGEEQGLLGSKGYIERNKDLLPKISAVFVDDGGTNTQGGLKVADQMLQYIAGATAPTNYQFWSDTDGRWLNVDIKPRGRKLEGGGGSDHASFNAVGVPGFFWEEVGRVDYGYSWHTQHDRLENAVPEYLVQSSTNSAVVGWRLANAPTLLPRSNVEPDSKP